MSIGYTSDAPEWKSSYWGAKTTYPKVAGPAVQLATWKLYAVTDAELYAITSFEHQDCQEGQFCRNPLHPGPCKGWKHTLHTVAPGAYHAYEQARVKKLNEKRLAKIKALKDLGKPVPKSLLKEITYAQVPKPPAGVTPTAVPGKEALEAIPTKAAIGAKLDTKNAAKKTAELDKLHAAQTTAMTNIAKTHYEANGGHFSPAAEKKLAAGMVKAQKETGPTGNLSDHPLVANTLKHVAEHHANAAELTAQQKAGLLDALHAHVENGIEEPPLQLTSAINQAKDIKAKKDADAALKIEKAAYNGKAKTFLESYDKANWDEATLDAKKKAVDNLHNVLDSGHLTPETKAAVNDMIAKIHEAKATPKTPAEQATTILKTPGLSVTAKAGYLSKKNFDALPKDIQDHFVQKLQDIVSGPIFSADVKTKAAEALNKFLGKPEEPAGKSLSNLFYEMAGSKAHVHEAEQAAKGLVKKTAKQKVDLYGKLTPEEYHGLPVDTQHKIMADLDAAKAKFLDVKKVNAVNALQEKLGVPGESTDVVKNLLDAIPGSPTPAQMTAAHGAAKVLAGFGPLNNPASVQKMYEGSSSESYMKDAAEGLGQTIATIHGVHHKNAHYTPEEMAAVTKKFQDEVHHMISTGSTEPPKGGVIHAATFLGDGAHEGGKAAALKSAAGLPKAEAGAGNNLKPDVIHEMAEKNVKGHQAAAEALGVHWTGTNNLTGYFNTAHSNGQGSEGIDAQANALLGTWLHSKLPAGWGEQHPGIVSAMQEDIYGMIEHGMSHPDSGGPLEIAEIHSSGSTPENLAKALDNWAQDAGVVEHGVSTPAGGAGAGGGVTSAKPPTSAQAHAAYVAVSQLSGGQGSKTSAADFEQAMQDGTYDEMVHKIAVGVGKLWASQNSSATTAEKEAAVGEIENQIKNGQTAPSPGGILAQYAPTGYTPPAAPLQLGTHGPGEKIGGVGHVHGLTVSPDPISPHQNQLVSESNAAEVAAFNKKLSAAQKGQAGLKQAALSISSIKNMGDQKFGQFTASAVANALSTYSGSAYDEINSYLRKKANGENVSEPHYDKIERAINAGFKKSKLKDDVVVYRGIKTGKRTWGDAFSETKSMVGAEATAKGLVSTSTSQGVAQGFAGYGGKGMMMRIVVPKGSPAISLVGGYHSHEDELLLPEGAKLRVVADNGYQNGYRQLDVEVVFD